MNTFNTRLFLLLTIASSMSQAKQYMFRDIFDQLEDEMLASMYNISQAMPGFGNPSYELSETADIFVVKFAVPGLNKEDVEIVIDENTDGALLTVKAEVKAEEEAVDEAKTYRKASVYQQSFVQKIKLNQPVIAEEVQADLENGILTVTLPKAAPVKKNSHSVKIK